MIYLGIESSCDETAAALVEEQGGRLHILSNVVASQIETHRLYGGVVPEIASRAHIEAISGVVKEALLTAGLTMEGVDAIGVTAHPGLIGALLCGVNFAKGLAAAYGKPLLAIDHMKAHIAAAYCEKEPGEMPKPPFLAMAVSGGHTSIYKAEDFMHFTPVGETRDDAIGEAFDKIGRRLDLPYPAGAAFDLLAAEGFRRASGEEDEGCAYRAFKKTPYFSSPDYKLPSPAMHDGSLDFSFSGLKTAAINLLHRFAEKGQGDFDRAIFAAAYTWQAVEAVIGQLDRALRQTAAEDLVVAGGVAANSHLRRALTALAKKRGVRLHIPPLSLCGDNGAMVAAETHFAYAAGLFAGDDLNASAADGI